jgi:hypothetical protein
MKRKEQTPLQRVRRKETFAGSTHSTISASTHFENASPTDTETSTGFILTTISKFLLSV